jgi:hypothetical protein
MRWCGSCHGVSAGAHVSAGIVALEFGVVVLTEDLEDFLLRCGRNKAACRVEISAALA